MSALSEDEEYDVPLPDGMIGKMREGQMVLEIGDLKAAVQSNGEYFLLFNSKAIANVFMKKDEVLTREVLEHWHSYARRTNPKHQPNDLTYLEYWVNQHPTYHFGKIEPRTGRRVEIEIGELESGHTYMLGEDCWLGDDFKYVHFVGKDKEGAILRWHGGGDVRANYGPPEVWVGDFMGFMQEQNWCDWYGPEGFLQWNENFNGNFIYALDYMDSFDSGHELDSVVQTAIDIDPSVVSKEIAARILRHPQDFEPRMIEALKAQYGEARG